jgi:hypothetical protein
MSIVFGWNSFKVRSFTLAEIGIMKQPEPGLQFEVRQAYFHLFWIPMFGLGKRWVVRKGDKLYDMPDDIKALARKSLTGIRMPWYTCAGPIMVVTGVALFSVITMYKEAQRHKEWAKEVKDHATELTAKLQHLTTNDFITIEDQLGRYGQGVYLKVEDIQGDTIMVTKIKTGKGDAMEVENEYTKHAGTLPSIKVSQKQLLAAYAKELEGGYILDRLHAVNLLNDDNKYIVKDVVRHYRPIVKVSSANFYKDEITIPCHNEGWPAIITDMKNVEGNIDWSEVLNKKLSNSLTGKNAKYRDRYKFVMTLKDTTGHIYKYEINGRANNEIAIQEL